MTNYFKDVNGLAEWLYEPTDANSERSRRSHVLENQQTRAKRAIEKGGFLLSRINGVQSWAGLSKIIGTELLKSEGTAWDRAFPYYFQIEPIHILRTQAKCFLVRESALHTGYDGRGIYTQMLDANACELIRSAIESVASMTDEKAEVEAKLHEGEFAEFNRVWVESVHRSTFLRDLVIEQSKGSCSICGATKQEWIDRIVQRGTLPKQMDINRIREDDYQLLHAHHLEWVKDGGTARIENLKAVCPNCHDMLTRGGNRHKPEGETELCAQPHTGAYRR